MYFCEDHGSVSDDGTGTVLHFQDSEEPAEPLEPPSSSLTPPPPPHYSLAVNGLQRTQTPSPSLKGQDEPQHQEQLLHQLQPSNCVSGVGVSGSSWSPSSPSDGGNRSGGNRSSLDNEDDLASSHEPEASNHSAPNSSQTSSSQHELQKQQPPPQQKPQQAPHLATAATTSATVLTPIGGANGLHRLGAASGAYILQAAAGCAYQEIREISLGRHNEEPFGMKVENVGEGFFITHVVRNSVAACAGLKIGDEIVRINDRRLEGLRTKEVLQVIRQSELCVKLAYKPRAVVARIREVRLKKSNGLLGLRLQKKPDGLYIDYVRRGTVAHEAGLKDGDQVLKINSHIVTDWSMEGAMALLKSLGDSEQLVLLVRETLPIAQLTAAAANNASSVGQQGIQLHQPQHHANQLQPHQPDGHHQEDTPPDLSDGGPAASRNGMLEDSSPQQQPPPPPTDVATPPSPDDEGQKARAAGSNPCASTDDLEITRLPPDDAGGSAQINSNAIAGPSSTGGFSSSILKSFHAPNRLTAFLKSARLNRQPANAASASKDKGHIA